MSKEIAESSFEYLLSEILTHVEQQSSSTDAINTKMERLGYQIGIKYIEKVVSSLKVGSTHLDIIKFMCKEFYEVIFQKKVILVWSVSSKYSIAIIVTFSCTDR